MPLDVSKTEIVSLDCCLVEGNAEQRARERKSRRRALTLSLIAQATVLTVVVLAPLFARVPPVAALNYIPVPPYHPPIGDRQVAVQRHAQSNRPQVCRFCPPTRIPTATPNTLPPDEPTAPTGIELQRIGSAKTSNSSDQIGIFDPRAQPQAPHQPQGTSRIKKGGLVQEALLIHRVEPKYPVLMQQIRKSGRVELHAVISADGTIESLQVVSGDTGFYQSALEAVRQWRYKPTILNGQPVEVETSIAVIYNIGQ